MRNSMIQILMIKYVELQNHNFLTNINCIVKAKVHGGTVGRVSDC